MPRRPGPVRPRPLAELTRALLFLILLCPLAALRGAPLAEAGCSTPLPQCPPSNGSCGPRQDCASCTAAVDDDGDCRVDEEILNGIDDDGDACVDEDISCLNTCDPMAPACYRPVPFDELNAPLPIPLGETLALDAKFRHFSCSSPAEEESVTVELRMLDDPSRPNPWYCGGYDVVVDVKQSGSTLLTGLARLVHTRRWQSLEKSLVPGSGAEGTVQVFRYLVKADLKRPAGVSYAALPPALRMFCNEDQAARPHVFLYGHFDLAQDSVDPSLRAHALVAAHAPSRLSHPPVPNPLPPACAGFGITDCCDNPNHISRRPLLDTEPGAHPSDGWFLVAPGASFTFNTAIATLDASGTQPYQFGKIRQLPSAAPVGTPPAPCATEWRICQSRFSAGPASTCSHIVHRDITLCGEIQTGSTPVTCNSNVHGGTTTCNTVPANQVALLPVGSWSASAFPANMTVSALEGGIYCTPNAYQPYWYGTFTHQERSAGGHWLGPLDTIDVVNNQGFTPSVSSRFLLGGLNWLNEGTPSEIFAAKEERAMYFFDNTNPDINTLTPCEAHAEVAPPGPVCHATPCVTLSGAPSTVKNCCQCGSLQYRWRQGVTILRDWDPDPTHSVCPTATTDYELDVRCSTSQNACTDTTSVRVYAQGPSVMPTATPSTICGSGDSLLEANVTAGEAPVRCSWNGGAPGPCSILVSPGATTTYSVYAVDANGCESSTESVTVTVSAPVASAGPDVAMCAGDTTTLSGTLSGGTPPPTCAWTPGLGLGDPASCTTSASPGATTTYTLTLTDAAGCQASDDVTVQIDDVVLSADAGKDQWLCAPASVTLSGSGSATGCPAGVLYRWRRLAPSVGWECGGPAWSASGTCIVNPTETSRYELEVRCASYPEPFCTTTDSVTVSIRKGHCATPASCCGPEQDCATLAATSLGIDDDGDGAVDEEEDDGVDNDNDGCVDEDIHCSGCFNPAPYRGCAARPGTQTHPFLPGTLSDLGTVFRWSTSLGHIDQLSGLPRVTITTHPPHLACAERLAWIDVKYGAQSIWLDGHLIHARSFQMPAGSLLPNASGHVCVDRYLGRFRASYTSPGGSAQPWVAPPCHENGARPVNFYGHLDYAYECLNPGNFRHSLVLTHAQGQLSHPDCAHSKYPFPSNHPLRHDTEGFSLVSPHFGQDGQVFQIDINRTVPNGDTLDESVRYDAVCYSALPILGASLSAPLSGPPNTGWVRAEIDALASPVVSPCECDRYASAPICEIPQDRLAALSIGSWIASAFPGNQTVHAVEGFVLQAGLGDDHYVYGAATQNLEPSFPTLLDVANNFKGDLQPGDGPWDEFYIGAYEGHDQVLSLFNSRLPDPTPSSLCY